MGRNKYEHLRPVAQSDTPEMVKQKDHASRYFVAEHDRDIPTLDFHGMPTAGVDVDVENFLLDKFGQGQEAVKIIYGHGTGVMRKAVKEHLKRISSDLQFSIEAYREDSNGTYCLVLLKK